MEQYSIIIILLAISVGLSAISPKMKIPYPIVMLIGGIFIGLIPGFRRISIDSNLVFLIFLPPLLYDAASNISFKHFTENFNIISFLAISLVFATMVVIAVFVYFCIPEINWPLAFLLGAILSPPDAVAALGITSDLNLSPRLRTILEGEGMINDASALTACRFALAAVSGTKFILLEACFSFCLTILGGIIIGFFLWYLFKILVRKTKSNRQITTSLNLLLPFVVFLIADGLKVSAILAVVTTGLLMAKDKKEIYSTNSKFVSETKLLWNTVTYILNGLIFMLLGIEFPHVIKQIPANSLVWLILCSFLIFLVALLVRISVLSLYKINWDKKLLRLPTTHHFFKFSKKEHHRVHLNFDPITWKELIVISCSGMRGIVSLAVALAIPCTLANGCLFPERDTIIFLTTTVVVIMLIVQGIGLYPLLHFLKLSSSEKKTSKPLKK